MKIFWIRIPKKLQWLLTLLILWLLAWIYKNIALLTIIILSIIFIFSLLYWVSKTTDNYGFYNHSFTKKIWYLFIILSLFPLYFSLYIYFNYEESNKYLQDKSIWWLIEIWKFALTWRKFTVNNIIKYAEKSVIDNTIEEVAKETIKSIPKKTSLEISLSELDLWVNIQSWALNLNPTLK